MRENFIACPVFNRIRFNEGGADILLFIAIFKSINRSKLSGATLRSNFERPKKIRTNKIKEDHCFTLGKHSYLCKVAKNQKFRKITFYKSYFQDFFDRQTKKVKAKIVWTFQLVEDLQRVPETYLKHIENTDGLYEIRIQLGRDIFRIFCFFYKGRLVVLANGFQKKSQKTPKKEIEKALKIKAEYENEK